ncbi:MAG: glycosyltransferase family 39 protein [Lachnospiraceae bacterium]|nr:glycosyltransferase family 39 protein [Lachnospiraceae bacterium]
MKDKTKISWLDYKWWFIFAVCTVFLAIRVGERIADITYGLDNPLIKGGFIFLTFIIYAAIAYIIYLLGRLIGPVKNRAFLILSEVVIWIVLIEIFVLRYLFPVAVSQNNLLFIKASMISLDNEAMVFAGAASLYVDVLSLLFAFLGNHEIMVIYLQFTLQILTIILIFFAIRFLCGEVSSYFAVFMLAVSLPFMEAVLIYQPEVVYLFLWSLGFFFLTLNYRISLKETGLKARYLGLTLTGFLTGVIFYFDMTGILLAVTGFYLLFIVRADLVQYIFKNFFFLIGIMSGFFIMIFRESVVHSNILMENLINWLDRLTLNLNLNVLIPAENLPLLIIISVFCLSLVFFFLQNVNKSFVIFAFYILILCVVFPMLGLKTVNLNMWITLAWASMAGLGFECLLAKAKKAGGQKDFGADEEILDEKLPLIIEEIQYDELAESQDDMAENHDELAVSPDDKPTDLQDEKLAANANVNAQAKAESRYDTSTGIKYLDNPLPLPAKPVRRVMDYPYIITSDKLHYDVEITDGDDFDV